MTNGDTRLSAANGATDRTEQGLVRTCSLVAGISTILAYYLPALLRQDVYTNDMAEWTSWAYGFADPALFEGDIHATYWLANFPPLYWLFFKVGAPFLDAQVLGETLGIAQASVALWLAYLLGKEVAAGRPIGGLVVLLFIAAGQVVQHPLVNLRTVRRAAYRAASPFRSCSPASSQC